MRFFAVYQTQTLPLGRRKRVCRQVVDVHVRVAKVRHEDEVAVAGEEEREAVAGEKKGEAAGGDGRC